MIDDHLECLRQRRDYLAARILAKKSVGWDSQYDQREHDALDAVIKHLNYEKFLRTRQSEG